MTPFEVFVYSAIFSGAAGLAAMLRSEKKLTIVGVISSVLNSGLLGLAISLLWYTKFQENLYFLIGVCVVAGLGGMSTVDMVLKSFMKKGGISISIGDNSIDTTSEEKKDDKEDK